MEDTTKAYIESISKYCYQEMTFYRFNTKTLQVNDKYREGRLRALQYVSELTYDYLQREKQLQNEFKQQLVAQMTEHARLMEDSEYKSGLYDALNDVLNYKPSR